MSTGKKKSRLALNKKTRSPKEDFGKNSPQPTILSIFKKQRNRHEEIAEESADKETNSEGDVVILGETQETTEHESDQETNIHSLNKKNEAASSDVNISKKKGRLSLVKKGKEESTLSKTTSLKVDREKKIPDETVKRKGAELECTPPYKLRIHRTVPVIEITSESDSDGDGDDVKAEFTSVTHRAVGDLPSSGSSDFQEKVKCRKRKRIVKRSYTADDISVKSRKKLAEKAGIPGKSTQSELSVGGSSSSKNVLKTRRKSTGGKCAEPISEDNSDAFNQEVILISNPKSSTKEKNKRPTPSGKRRKHEKEKESIKSETVTSKSIKQKSSRFENTNIAIEPAEPKQPKKELKQGTIHGLFKKKSTDALLGRPSSDDIDRKSKDKDIEDEKGKGKYDNGDAAAEKNNLQLKSESSEVVELTEEAGENEEAEEKTEVLYRIPYYLENFRTILDSVLADKENARLFNEIDMAYVTAFNGLTGSNLSYVLTLHSF